MKILDIITLPPETPVILDLGGGKYLSLTAEHYPLLTTSPLILRPQAEIAAPEPKSLAELQAEGYKVDEEALAKEATDGDKA